MWSRRPRWCCRRTPDGEQAATASRQRGDRGVQDTGVWRRGDSTTNDPACPRVRRGGRPAGAQPAARTTGRPLASGHRRRVRWPREGFGAGRGLGARPKTAFRLDFTQAAVRSALRGLGRALVFVSRHRHERIIRRAARRPQQWVPSASAPWACPRPVRRLWRGRKSHPSIVAGIGLARFRLRAAPHAGDSRPWTLALSPRGEQGSAVADLGRCSA